MIWNTIPKKRYTTVLKQSFAHGSAKEKLQSVQIKQTKTRICSIATKFIVRFKIKIFNAKNEADKNMDKTNNYTYIFKVFHKDFFAARKKNQITKLFSLHSFVYLF